jgi:hypothetical protein
MQASMKPGRSDISDNDVISWLAAKLDLSFVGWDVEGLGSADVSGTHHAEFCGLALSRFCHFDFRYERSGARRLVTC